MSEKKRPAQANSPRAENPQAKSPAPETAVYQWFEQEDQEDQRSFRASLMVALVAHLLILFATIPTLASKEIDEPTAKKYIKLAPITKMKKEILEPRKIPEPKALKIPMPDPDPDDIEIYVEDEVVEPVIDLPPDVFLAIPAEPSETPAPTGPIRVSADFKAPKKIHFVQPMYTEIARKARIEGVVIVEAVIDRNGLVRDTTVLKGLPLGLTENAVKAVRQWRFEQPVMNGKPVDIIFVLTVHFRLN